MNTFVLVVAILGLVIGITAFIKFIIINKKTVKREEINAIKKELVNVEKRIDQLYR